MRKWSLDQLTVAGVRPFELVEIAARAGYDAIGAFLGIGSTGGVPAVPLRAGEADTVEMARRLADTGLFINTVDGVTTTPDVDLDAVRAGIELVANMGARSIVLHQVDNDQARGFDRYCALCDCAAEAGLQVMLEFTPLLTVATLDDAVTFRERVGRDHVGILVDILHLYRSGGDVAAMRDVDPALIRGAQFCDAPLVTTREQYWREAIQVRQVPGQGELPVAEFLSALPADIVVGIEVPDRSREWSVDEHVERAKALLATSRALA